MKKDTLSVAELIEELKKCNPASLVYCSVYESCITDAGTDLGDNVLKTIDSACELGSRVELTTSTKW